MLKHMKTCRPKKHKYIIILNLHPISYIISYIVYRMSAVGDCGIANHPSQRFGLSYVLKTKTTNHMYVRVSKSIEHLINTESHQNQSEEDISNPTPFFLSIRCRDFKNIEMC
jgi:hypothetical protein